MLKIAICDDERTVLEDISCRIRKMMPDCEITTFFSGEALLEQGECFDIYFLDVQMKKMDGITLAGRLKEEKNKCAIVFISDAAEYAVDAFDVAALHYLVKPVSDQKLKEALERAVREAERNKNREKKQIIVTVKGKHMTLNADHIIYLENDRRKIIAHTSQGNIIFYGVMQELEEELGNGFYRCHRGYLINFSHVREYTKDSVMLTGGETVYLAKERYPDFVKTYTHYLKNGGTSSV